MKKFIGVCFRFIIEISLLMALWPIICIILGLALINYLIMGLIHRDIIDNGFIEWSRMIKKGIDMNIDFIVNGL